MKLFVLFFVITHHVLFAKAIITNPTCLPTDIVGKWQYWGYIYEGVEQKRTNLNLLMFFEFDDWGNSLLYWRRRLTKGFCYREGLYTYQHCQLSDRVVLVASDNRFDCVNDPDMQINRESVSRLEKIGDRLYLHASLSGKPFVYIWVKKQPDVLQ
jgi:hypothetical protein